ncbi:MAG: hypothetical protein VZR53_18625 [Prevotella sp.]|nr:hypothetical protein [Prevotella sp.]
MKKIALLTLIFSIFLLSSCQDAIFEAIMEDVIPESATVSGNITNITRYTVGTDEEYLFLAADGGLRYKPAVNTDHGAWQVFELPFGLIHYNSEANTYDGEQILTVLADDVYLYLVTTTYTYDLRYGQNYPNTFKIWALKDFTKNGDELEAPFADWDAYEPTEDEIKELFPIAKNSDDYYYSNFNVFQTNAPKQAHRAAYLRSYNTTNNTHTYYKFNGGSKPSVITLNQADIIDANRTTDSSYVAVARSAVWFNGIKFIASRVATTNETYDDDPTYYYYTNGNSKLYYNSSDTETNASGIDANTSYIISALATTEDSILIGYGSVSDTSAGGIGRMLLNSGVPTKLASFETNAAFQITSSYKVVSLLNATPDQPELDSNLYASVNFASASNSFDNIGLWSYYPERGLSGWNRE